MWASNWYRVDVGQGEPVTQYVYVDAVLDSSLDASMTSEMTSDLTADIGSAWLTAEMEEL